MVFTKEKELLKIRYKDEPDNIKTIISDVIHTIESSLINIRATAEIQCIRDMQKVIRNTGFAAIAKYNHPQPANN